METPYNESEKTKKLHILYSRVRKIREENMDFPDLEITLGDRTPGKEVHHIEDISTETKRKSGKANKYLSTVLDSFQSLPKEDQALIVRSARRSSAIDLLDTALYGDFETKNQIKTATGVLNFLRNKKATKELCSLLFSIYVENLFD